MPPSAEWRLGTKRLGRRVLVFDALDSTSTFAASLTHDRENDGLVVLAREQTAGRGQHGRSWHAPADSSVLMSAVLFPPPALRRPALLTAWAAVSVCEVILRITGLQAKIKWPNDVLIRGRPSPQPLSPAAGERGWGEGGRKVCGILIEQNHGTVVGIGLNVNQTTDDFDKAGLPEAGSLAMFTGNSLDTQAVARQLIQQLDEEYEHLCQGDLAGLESCWKRRVRANG